MQPFGKKFRDSVKNPDHRSELFHAKGPCSFACCQSLYMRRQNEGDCLYQYPMIWAHIQARNSSPDECGTMKDIGGRPIILFRRGYQKISIIRVIPQKGGQKGNHTACYRFLTGISLSHTLLEWIKHNKVFAAPIH